MSDLFRGRIAVDLDGTLAHQDRGHPYDHKAIGDPVPAMARRVEQWLHDGIPVVIFTARLWSDGSEPRNIQAAQSLLAIQQWCFKHFGGILPVTCVKDPSFIEMWDDRSVQVVPNTGERVDGQ